MLIPNLSSEQAKAELESKSYLINTNAGNIQKKILNVHLLHSPKFWENGTIYLPLMILLGIVLSIAGANLTGIYLAQSESRKQEMAIRVALGGGRIGIMRLFFCEGLLIASLSTLVCSLVVYWVNQLIPALIPLEMMNLKLYMDLNLILFTFFMALITANLSLLVPVLMAVKSDLNPLLKNQPTSVKNKKRFFTRKTLVICQMAVALTLLISSLTLSDPFLRKFIEEYGTLKDHLIISLTFNGTEEAKGWIEYHLLQERIKNIPSIKQITLSSAPEQMRVYLPGKAGKLAVKCRMVDPNYFKFMETSLLQGRTFTEEDKITSMPVAVINEEMAKNIWPNENPLGKTLLVEQLNFKQVEIIGITKNNEKDTGINPRSSMPLLHLPFYQIFRPEMELLLDCEGRPIKQAAVIRQVIDKMKSDFQILEFTTRKDAFIKNNYAKAAAFAFEVILLNFA
jgi:ABC-type lipoprotein release transport system permease subunit